MFFIYGGFGTDGGFGDYSPPYWSEMPMTDREGNYVWVGTKEDAVQVVDNLNSMSMDEFYKDGGPGSYSGEFPFEYQYREVPTVVNEAFSVGSGVIALTNPDLWKYDDYYIDCGEDTDTYDDPEWRDVPLQIDG